MKSNFHQLIFSIEVCCPITQSNCVTTICSERATHCVTTRSYLPVRKKKCMLRTGIYAVHLKATKRESGEGERDLFISSFFRFLGTRSASSVVSPDRNKEEGIWFHLTLLPFQRCCSGSVVRARGWGSVRYLKQPPSPLPISLQEHYQHTGRHKWVRCCVCFAFLYGQCPK